MESGDTAVTAEPKSQADFQELTLPVRTLNGTGKSRYRVYDTSAQCKEVEAETAVEAMKVSGVEAPIRIEREIHGREVLVDMKKLLDKSAAA